MLSHCLLLLPWLPGLEATTIVPDKRHDILEKRDNILDCKLPGLDTAGGVGWNFIYSHNTIPSYGHVQNLVIFVDFSDKPGTDPNEPQQLYQLVVPPTQSFYTNASYGNLKLQYTSDYKFYRMPNTSTSYQIVRGGPANLHRKYYTDAISAYLKAPGNSITSPYGIIYVIPTMAATGIEYSSNVNANQQILVNGNVVSRRVITIGANLITAGGPKVFTHETGHSLGLPDYYPDEGNGGFYIGGWSIMAITRATSPDFFAWDKWRFSWLPYSMIGCVASKGTFTFRLTPIETYTDGGFKAVVVKNNATSALVAEVRSNKGNNWGTCNTPGVLLYRMNTDVGVQNGPIVVQDTAPNTMGCANQPKNDGTLQQPGSSFTLDDWKIKVTLQSRTVMTEYTIQITKS